ncbi:MAG: TatD family hydrolase [Minisyncoccia bacterium]|jgi:TatD DNase family protein
MEFFDAHAHTQFSAYDADREAVIRRAEDASVRVVNVGTQRDTSARAVALAEQHAGFYAAVGLHPIHTSRSYHDTDELGGGETAKGFVSRDEVFDPDRYKALALHPKTVAIGECGLDYFRFNKDESREEQIERQKAAFLAQIAFAREVKKPLMIHCRDAFADLIQLLKENTFGFPAGGPGVIHFFTGTAVDAKQLLDLGFYFTFGGAVTFPPRKGKTEGDYDAIVKMIPADRLLSETDAPYVAPAPYRGKRNEPAYVVEVVKKLAELKNVSPDAMKERIYQNAVKVFNLLQN